MKLTRCTPMLRTVDLPRTLRFYSEVLGFQVVARDDGRGWASLERDGVAVMIATANAHAPFVKAAFTGSLYFETDNVDAIWEQVRGKCDVCYPPEEFDYGMREFGVYDDSGYLLQFGQPM